MTSIHKKIENKLQTHPYVYYVIRSLSRLIKRDINYINFAIKDYSNPKRILIQSFGEENIGKILYCIREQGKGYGFFAEFRALLCNLIFAEEMGFTPNIYWGKEHLYFDQDISYTDNVFEYYFEPVKLENLCQSKNVFFSSDLQIDYIEEEFCVTGYTSCDNFERKLVQIIKQYIHIRPELLKEFETEAESILRDGKILGIHHRGTDYKKEYKHHPKMMQIEQGIVQAEKMLKEYEIDNIFLATDDEEILESYKKAFGSRVRYFSDVLRSASDVSVAFSQENRKYHHYILGREVLRDVYVLSQCTCLLSGKSQVSYFADIFNQCSNDRYLKCELIDNGINETGQYFDGKRKS